MASDFPMMNGDLSHPAQSQSTGAPHVEETLQQMNILIKENRELKEALKQTNLSMKERFEGLSAWKEKQKEERGFLEKRLEEAKQRVQTLDSENELLRKRVQEMEKKHADADEGESGSQAKLEALTVQIARLQAEKNDLVAINSELQLKMSQASPEDSFIEIRIAKGEMDLSRDLPSQKDLTASSTIAELEPKELKCESGTQMSLPCVSAAEETQSKISQEEAAKSASEVENLKAQLMNLFKELQQAQSKLDEAENMKKNLQDRCKELEQDLCTLKIQLGEREQLQAESDSLKLQLESMQAAKKLEQLKLQEERNALAQLKDAYTKLFEDYDELQQDNKKRQGSVLREEHSELQSRMNAAEKALADKQQQIDVMKQELYEKDKELETVSVFKAQAEVYSSDFYAERAAREKIHEEKERLAAQLEFIKKQNIQLQDEMESMGRQSMSEMQRRHVPRGTNPDESSPHHHHLQGGRVDWQQHVNIPEHACPKCGEVLPDLDSLQIHIMDCII
ncbi:Optineurin [Bagarius yarrelli]|uniref:Optineurin n=1 Tax=Bagarius yarrelli TaxID=175774 RepID=A0A556THM9_BAGYA|nr:Optineurin [Bagarius yarrelli]